MLKANHLFSLRLQVNRREFDCKYQCCFVKPFTISNAGVKLNWVKQKSTKVEDKIYDIYDVVQQLPPPHYRTLSFLMRHLHDIVKSSSETNMNTKNLAIVWAPNLLK